MILRWKRHAKENYGRGSVYSDAIKDYNITQTINEIPICEFKVPLNEENLTRFDVENFIQNQYGTFVIKQISIENNNWINVYSVGQGYVGEFPKVSIQMFGDTVQSGLIKVVDKFTGWLGNDANVLSIIGGENYGDASTEWNCEVHSKKANYVLPDVTYVLKPIDIIRLIAQMYDLYFIYDTTNLIIHFYDNDYSTKSLTYFSNELLMSSLKYEKNTLSLATIIKPTGMNGLTISNVNNFVPYLLNYDYLGRGYYKELVNTNIADAQQLKDYSEEYLKKYSVPQEQYTLTLAYFNEDMVTLGQNITVVDKLKSVKSTLQVVSMTIYPLEPERSTLELANIWDNFIKNYAIIEEAVIQSDESGVLRNRM